MAYVKQNNLYRSLYYPCMYCFHSCHRTKHDMTVRKYRVRRVNDTDGTAAKRESRDCSRNEARENGGHCGTETDEVPQAEGARDVERKLPIAETVP